MSDSFWKYSTFILAAFIVVGMFVFLTGPSTGNAVRDSGIIDIDDDAVLGDKNAPVTIIEFSDYQCPFCQRFWADTLPLLKSEYIDSGKVKLVYRDLPLIDAHPMAQKAAEAAECVGEKGDEAYFAMHDRIFANQHMLTISNLKSWANNLGYNIDSCLDSGKMTREVQQDLADSQAAGIQGTPNFIINGRIVTGAQPYSVFRDIIESELAKV